ncbi:hypothetical protein EON83_12600 [bacterium]|nr:MAG: hypothetical protein EON83_12600 [bacterium]
MNQLQILAGILHRYEAGAVADIEKTFKGVEMAPEVKAVYSPMKERVKKRQKDKSTKTKGAST